MLCVGVGGLEFHLLAAWDANTDNAARKKNNETQDSNADSETWGGADVVVVQYNPYLAGELDLVWPAGSTWTKVSSAAHLPSPAHAM